MIILLLLLKPCSQSGSTRPQIHQIRTRKNNGIWYYFYAPPPGTRGVNLFGKSPPPQKKNECMMTLDREYMIHLMVNIL